MSEDITITGPFEAHVWKTLGKIDVTDHVDQLPKTNKRPAVSYLAWHKAWMLLKRHFPASTYAHRQDIFHPDGTVEVEVDVVISYDGSNTMFTNARLPVMNNWFGAIENPNARDINDARQRCLVKALAFAGLGLNLWSESMIPVGKLVEPITAAQYEMLSDLITKTETDEEKFLEWCEVEDLTQLPFEKYTSALRLLEAKVRRMSKGKDDESS